MTAFATPPQGDLDGGALDFEGTSGGVTYGTLVVPMDYAQPDGDMIRVAFSVRSATAPADAPTRGALLVINGGPGGDNALGVDMPAKVASATDLGYHYDLVGIDFRGRGKSSRLTTRSRPSSGAPVTRPGDEHFADIAEDMRQREALCVADGGAFREHVTTMNIVRDIEQLRLALDYSSLSIVGMAYGSLVAATYGTLYPESTGRLVLDSVVNPTENWQERFREQVESIRANVQDWAHWTARGEGKFQLGSSRDAVIASVEAVATKVQDLSGGPHLVSALDTMVGRMTSEEASWPTLSTHIARLRDAVTENDTGYLARSLSQSAGWRPADVELRQQEAVLEAVTSETAWSADLSEYYADMRTVRDTCPYGFSVMRVQPWVGTFRAKLPDEKVPVPTGDGLSSPLIVQSQRDTLSRESNGRVMADLLQGKLMRLIGTGVHEAFMFGGFRAVDDAIVRYLTTGECPPLVVIDCRDSAEVQSVQ
jgi:pimeloyl-ACP methyl ester carboxylesterase